MNIDGISLASNAAIIASVAILIRAIAYALQVVSKGVSRWLTERAHARHEEGTAELVRARTDEQREAERAAMRAALEKHDEECDQKIARAIAQVSAQSDKKLAALRAEFEQRFHEMSSGMQGE